MPSYYEDVKAFHEAFNLPIGYKPEIPDYPQQRLRLRVIREEHIELIEAHEAEDIVEIADAIADLIYFACGMAVVYGIPLDEVWAEVHRSNMAKLVDGKAIYREDGKVLKPEGWTPPNVKGVIDACKA